MRKRNIIQKIITLMQIACKFALHHSDSTTALTRVFTRQWPGDTVADGHTEITLQFLRYGSCYRVVQQFLLKGQLQRESVWAATYGWHSNGHLMEIGGYRYCIFNPQRGMLYLEYYDDDAAEKKVEIYYEHPKLLS